MRICIAPFFISALGLLVGCTTASTYKPNNQAPHSSNTQVSNTTPLPDNFPTAPLIIPKTPPPTIYAKSAIVVDALTGRPIYQKNPDEARQVASTQKLITALVVMDAGDLHKQVTIQKTDLDVQPTRLNFRPGDVYERGELLQALMVKSCNDIARALGRDVAGSAEAFPEYMNRKARSIGMYHSHFCNPHGLTVSGQYSTARDMAKAALVAYRNPIIRQFINTRFLTFHFSNGHTKELRNTNHLLHDFSWVTGMKTGTTDAAGRCLISSGGLNGRHAIVVILGSTTPHIWEDSKKLLSWAVGA